MLNNVKKRLMAFFFVLISFFIYANICISTSVLSKGCEDPLLASEKEPVAQRCAVFYSDENLLINLTGQEGLRIC